MRAQSHEDAMDEILHYVRYEPETGHFYWNCDVILKSGLVIAEKDTRAGTPTSAGYVKISVKGKQYLAHRLAWAIVHGKWPENEIDHRNLNKSDNSILNLRECNGTQNQGNKPKLRNNTSGYTGVDFLKKRGVYLARIKVNRKAMHLGVFPTAELASAEYQAAAIRYFGPFARSLNP